VVWVVTPRNLEAEMVKKISKHLQQTFLAESATFIMNTSKAMSLYIGTGLTVTQQIYSLLMFYNSTFYSATGFTCTRPSSGS
jgi:hypothetical protein